MSSRRRELPLALEPLEVRTLLSGQAVQLIKDVNTIESYPADLTPAGSNLFYLVEDSSNSGVDLMVTNSIGTQILGDSGGSSPTLSSNPHELTPVGNDVYFLTSSNSLGMSDGTANGTAQVSLPSTVQNIQSLTNVGNALLFESSSYNYPEGEDYQLWAIAQPGASPTMIQDFGSSTFYTLSVIGGTAYLSVDGNLWTTDGTAANTQEVEDSSGNPITSPDSIFGFDGQAYYYDSTADTIGILGRSGEMPEVTLPAGASYPVVVDSELYFTAPGPTSDTNDQLWSSDGTQANTQMVEDFSTISTVSSTASPSNLTDAAGTLFFTVPGTDGLNQLWSSNGTGQGTALVKDLGSNASAYSGYSYGYGGASSLGLLAPVGNNLFFMAYDSTNGAELWSDGVATGTTQLVDDIDPGAGSSSPHDFAEFNNQLYFAANDGTTPLVNELWTTDGTSAGTTLVASFSPGINQGSGTFNSYNSTTSDFAALGSQLLLPLDDGIHGTALWATDGTAAGTTLVSQVDPQGFAVLDGTAYFLGTGQGTTFGLWQTNGTTAGTSEVKDLSQYGSATGYYGSSSGQMVASGNEIYFTTSDGSNGVDLWASNGTKSGTKVVKDFSGGDSYYDEASVSDLTPFGGNLAFIATDPTHGTQVWITGGTVASTVMLTDLNDSSEAYGTYTYAPSSLTVANGQLYFIAGTPGSSSSSSSEGLWVSDGTPGGTSEFDDSLPTISYTYQTYGSTTPTTDTATPTVANLTAVGSSLYFSLDYDYDTGENYVQTDQLWTSGGTLASTVEVPAPASGPAFTSISDFHALGSLLLFEAGESSGPVELWKSDGTLAGTAVLKVISPSGSANNYYGQNSENTVVDNGILYFVADDGTDGSQLWQSDGTSSGTFMVSDLNPGGSADPVPLAVVNGQVVLEANDGTHGQEPMVVVSTGVTANPELETIPTQDITVGGTVQLDVALYASDPNSPSLPLKFSLTGSNVPSGAIINATTGVFSWPTTGQQTGTYTFTLQVSDNSTPALTTSETFTVDVNPVEPPVLSIPGYEYVTVGETFTLDVSQYASDPNTPPLLPLTYELTGNVPSGASIVSTTGILTWATASNQMTGSYSFTVQVSNDATPAESTSQTFTVYVDPVESPYVSTIPGQGVDIGNTLTLDVSTYAHDSNYPPFPLNYSLTGTVPPGASIDPTTGLFSWTPSSNQPTGIVTIDVQVTDNHTTPVTATFVVEVGAPGAILSPLLSAIPTYVENAGQTDSLYLASYASDPNSPALQLSYTLTGTVPSGASINSSTGQFTWVIPSDQPAGLVTFTLTVSDTSSPPMTASETFSVNVRTASGIYAPVLQTIPAQNADIGSALQLNVSSYASDPNYPALTLKYSLGAGAPDGASIDQNTGIFTWTPATGQATGATPITVIVSDNQTPADTATETFTVNVFSAGTILPPELAYIGSGYAVIGEQFQLNISNFASDPNTPAQPLTYSVLSGAPSGVSINPTTGLLTWTPAANQPAGSASITVLVADNQSPALYATETFSVNVASAGSQTFAPEFISYPSLYVDLGSTLTFDFANYATDPNTPPSAFTYTLGSNSPVGASIDQNTGIFTWTPGMDQATGSVYVTVMLSDNQRPYADTSSATFQIQVDSPGTTLPFVFEPVPSQNAKIGQQLQLDLSPYAVDFGNPGSTLTYSLIGNVPSGASIDQDTGIFTWTPAADQPTGQTYIELSVTDASSNTAYGYLYVNVSPAVTIVPPVLQAIPAQSVMPGQRLQVDLSQYVTDTNSPPLSLSYTLGAVAPPGASIDQSGLLTWTPPSDQPIGPTLITVDVSDDESPADLLSETFTVNVSPVVTTPTITWSNPAGIVYGTALSGAQLDASASVAGTFQYAPALGKVLTAGQDQTLTVDFTPNDTIDYTTATDTVTINVNQATPVVSVNPVDLTTGTALANSQLSGTATWTVDGALVNVAGTFTYTSAAGTVLGAGNGQVESVTFTPQDTTDYSTVTTSVTVNVGQITESVTVNSVDLTYGTALANGQLSGTATATIGGTPTTMAGTYAYTSAVGRLLGAGNGQVESVTFTPTNTSEYTPVTTTVTVNVAPAMPSVSINPLSMTYGTALANSQLSGTATWTVNGANGSVPGTYAYTSAAGSVLGAGNGQTESVTFTPQDTTDYSAVTTTVTVNMAQATPIVSVNSVSLATGTALANSQLSGTATWTVGGAQVNVPGAYAYTSAAGTVLGAGNGQVESVTFTPTDTNDYSTVTTSVTVDVGQVSESVTVNPVDLTYGTALANTQLSGTATATIGGTPTTIAGTFAYSTAAGTLLKVGTGQVESVTFTPTDTTDYTAVTTTATVNVAPAAPVVSVTAVDLTYGTALAGSQIGGTATWVVGGSTVNVAGADSYTTAAGIVLKVGTGLVESVTFTPQDTTDYSTVTTTVTVNVSPATPVVSVTPVDLTYGTALANGQLGGTVTWVVGGTSVNIPGTYSYTSAGGKVLGAGAALTESVTFSPQDSTDYNSATSTVTMNVAQATPVVSVNPLSLTYGTALANSQLSGSASWTVNGVKVSVPGTYTYTSAAGTVPNAGSGQSESVTFTPQDTTDYNKTSAEVTLNVSAPPAVTLTLSSIPAQSVDVGQTFQLNLSSFASETNAPTLSLSYSLGSGAPSGASINPTTGVLSWSVGTNQTIGTYPITVQVSDNGTPQHSASDTFSLTVLDPNPVTISSATVSTKKGFTITLTFSGPVNPSTASNAGNYTLTEPGKKPKSKKKPTPPPTHIGLSVSYNQATNQVTLKGPKKQKTSPALTLTVLGTGITKLDGLELAGSGGQPGTNYVASVTGKAISPTSAVLRNTIAVRTAEFVRHAPDSSHPVKAESIRPAGPMALARTPSVRDVVLGVIPSMTNPALRTRHD
ncbi:MAG: putative Ig domain-containing protein [Isosphaeraceae bacterium]